MINVVVVGVVVVPVRPAVSYDTLCSGETEVARGCIDVSKSDGCEASIIRGYSATVCYCNSDKCNAAVTLSAAGCVIIAAALFVNVIIGHML